MLCAVNRACQGQYTPCCVLSRSVYTMLCAVKVSIYHGVCCQGQYPMLCAVNRACQGQYPICCVLSIGHDNVSVDTLSPLIKISSCGKVYILL